MPTRWGTWCFLFSQSWTQSVEVNCNWLTEGHLHAHVAISGNRSDTLVPDKWDTERAEVHLFPSVLSWPLTSLSLSCRSSIISQNFAWSDLGRNFYQRLLCENLSAVLQLLNWQREDIFFPWLQHSRGFSGHLLTDVALSSVRTLQYTQNKNNQRCS